MDEFDCFNSPIKFLFKKYELGLCININSVVGSKGDPESNHYNPLIYLQTGLIK